MKEYIITDEFLDDLTMKFASAQGQLKELIRCKDCDHHYGRTRCDIHLGLWFEDNYCDSSKRKEEWD